MTCSLVFSLQFAKKGTLPEAALHRAALPRQKVQRWVNTALKMGQTEPGQPALLSAEITVRIVGTEEARALNHSYRQRDYATNVLTFDYSATPHLAADLLLCAPVVAQEALDKGVSLQAHYAHLVVHGTLHAMGHDHEISDFDAHLMEALESGILQRLGFADPYEAAAP